MTLSVSFLVMFLFYVQYQTIVYDLQTIFFATEILFSTEVYPTGIRIYETYNPGAVVRIWAMCQIGWVKLWEGDPQVVGHTSRLFRPSLRKIEHKTG